MTKMTVFNWLVVIVALLSLGYVKGWDAPFYILAGALFLTIIYNTWDRTIENTEAAIHFVSNEYPSYKPTFWERFSTLLVLTCAGLAIMKILWEVYKIWLGN